jgi:protein-disulfide isomerase
MKKWIAVLMLIVGVVAGAAADRVVLARSPRAVAEAAPTRPASPAPAPPAPAPAQVEDPRAVYRVPLEDSPVRGPRDALVTIVEAADFECPFCKRAAATMKEVQAAYGGKVRFVFKHNPLSMHQHAAVAAMVAEEARVQGGDAKFWAMHDALYELPALDAGSLTGAARSLGLAEKPLEATLAGGRYLDRIRRDQMLLNALGARGTPTFFVNGRKVVGAQPFPALKAVVDEELAKAEALVRSGVAAKDVYEKIAAGGATAPVMVAAPANAAAPAEAEAAKVPLRADDVVEGAANAPVTIVLFSDFQCPFCARIEPALKQLAQAFPGKVRFAWRHQPLPFHPNALPAAKASEAARAQGKFWAMHDKLFADQQALSDATYERYARELGLDLARFRRDLSGEAAPKRIAEDQQVAASVGATGTPTLFVNCRKVVGAKPFEALEPLVQQEIRNVEAMTSKGEKADARLYDRACDANVAAARGRPGLAQR